MSLLHRAISALQRSFQSQQEIEDAYLAGSVDIYDLERRMRALDERDTQEPFHLRHSI
ncbi:MULTISPECIES: DUF3563 family protein [unclassified Variovorax]|uniref:DUF3563 family protein n=1 Tax=unclassified Variovorax TaxID=663243 RepID=UPI001BD44167|nr:MULTISPECIES: DUF3563 family protein [unclassified Variovorax]